MAENVWDTGRWANVNKVKIDFMTKYIFEHITKNIKFKNKSVLELGCGTGRLSYLFLKNGASEVTLVDSSNKAIEFAQSLFKEEKNYKIEKADILTYTPGKKFDIVFSSEVIEHFK